MKLSNSDRKPYENDDEIVLEIPMKIDNLGNLFVITRTKNNDFNFFHYWETADVSYWTVNIEVQNKTLLECVSCLQKKSKMT